MDILMALIPALTWGSIGLLTGKFGGSAGQQVFGMTSGAFILSAIIWLVTKPTMTPTIWLLGLVSGLFWAVGTSQQFVSFKEIGVSKAFPISTAGQLVTNALMGAIVFGEWKNPIMWLMGVAAIAIMVIGAVFIGKKDPKSPYKQSENITGNMRAGILALSLSTFGYLVYTFIPKAYQTWGGMPATSGSEFTFAILLPQTLGMVIGAFIFAKFMIRENNLVSVTTAKNGITGIGWAIGNLFMFLSAMSAMGLATAYTLSQMGVIISTFGAIIFLGEKKTKKEFVYTFIGTAAVIIGGVLVGMI